MRVLSWMTTMPVPEIDLVGAADAATQLDFEGSLRLWRTAAAVPRADPGDDHRVSPRI